MCKESICVIIPIYNTSPQESPAVLASAFAKARGEISEIVICDNSDQIECKEKNNILAKQMSIEYIDMNGNKGLSNAYNRAVSTVEEDIICILDDDTRVGRNFFVEINDAVRANPDKDIFLPIVYAGGMLFSPIKAGYFRYKSFKYISDCPKYISGINSGMTVRRTVYDTVQYRDDLFLDCVDHAFIKDARRHGFEIYIVKNARLEQSYSRYSDDLEASLTRMKLFANDYRAFYSDSFLRRLYCELTLAYCLIKYAVRFKSASFLRFNLE